MSPIIIRSTHTNLTVKQNVKNKLIIHRNIKINLKKDKQLSDQTKITNINSP